MSIQAIVAVSLAVFVAANVSVFAAPLQTVAVKQSEPGSVMVTVRSADEKPKAASFSLNLSGSSGVTKVSATDVSAAGDLAPGLATTVLLCIDRSGSMRAAIPAIKDALKDVLATPRPDLRIGVISFGSDISTSSPFVSDSGKTLAAINAIQGETGKNGKTKLFDAIDIATVRLKNDSTPGPKRLIVISDGKDQGSYIERGRLSSNVQQRGEAIDSIGFGAAAPKWSDSLVSLSTLTNGSFVLADSPSKLSEAISDDLGAAASSAYNVNFHYAAASGALSASAASLEYTGPGANAVPTVFPIAVPLAAPAPVAPAPPPAPPAPVAAVAAAVANQGASALTQRQADSSQQSAGTARGDSGKPPWSITILSVKIDLKALVGALLALAAALLAVAFRLRMIKPDEVVPEPTVSAPTAVARAGTRVSAMFAPPAPGRPTALLVKEGPRRQTVRYAIEKANVRVGADEENDLVVAGDEYVSRKHANIRFDSGTLYLTDLGSSNGTFRNGTRLGQGAVALSPGDTIRFGHTTWELCLEGDALASAPSRARERPVP